MSFLLSLNFGLISPKLTTLFEHCFSLKCSCLLTCGYNCFNKSEKIQRNSIKNKFKWLLADRPAQYLCNLEITISLINCYLFNKKGHNRTFICQKIKFENYKFYQCYMLTKHDHDKTFIWQQFRNWKIPIWSIVLVSIYILIKQGIDKTFNCCEIRFLFYLVPDTVTDLRYCGCHSHFRPAHCQRCSIL